MFRFIQRLKALLGFDVHVASYSPGVRPNADLSALRFCEEAEPRDWPDPEPADIDELREQM